MLSEVYKAKTADAVIASHNIGKRGPVDYVIETPNKRRTQRVCHVNMLKAYVERDWTSLCVITNNLSANTTLIENDNDPDFGQFTSGTKDTFSLGHLPDRDREQLQRLLSQYSDIFNDMPGKTTLCTHKIELKPETRPITLSPYGVHPEKSEKFGKNFI